MIDVTNPANPVRVGGYDTSGFAAGVAVAGNYAYLAETQQWTGSNYIGGGLLVIDVTNPANPVRVGGYETSGSAQGMAVSGNLIYLASGEGGLLILEQSRPPWLEISALNPFAFRVSGEPGASVRVQRSGNLADWEDWQTVTLGETPVQLSDPDAATNSARFFRAVQP
ncbi:MAG: hypothetical protein FJ387_08230 [Verrucomicrobia bacterium]|nr:hypothetical protein [Verrucomicrobiota bacterium]